MPATAVMGGIAAYGAYQSSKQSDAAQQAQKAQQTAIDKQGSLSDTLASYAQQQYASSKPALDRATSYYSKLVGGDRSAIQGAIAPEVQTINQNYEGTQKYLDQQGVRGGARDVAVAEANRQKTGQVAALPFQARSAAVGQLANIGSTGVSQAMQGLGGAAGANVGAATMGLNLGNQAFNQEQQQGQNVAQFGSSLANLFMNWKNQNPSGKGFSWAGLMGRNNSGMNYGNTPIDLYSGSATVS